MADTPRKKSPAPEPVAEKSSDVTVADILDGKATGTVGEDTKKASSMDQLAEYKDMLSEQRERQGRLRHVQQFLTSPLFLDLSDKPVIVSEDRDAIDERKSDLDYRIRVLESLCSILIEERDFLDRVQSEDEALEDDAGEPEAKAG